MNYIRELLKSHLKETEAIYNILTLYNLLDKQEVLNWLDKLNEISVRN